MKIKSLKEIEEKYKESKIVERLARNLQKIKKNKNCRSWSTIRRPFCRIFFFGSRPTVMKEL